MVKNHHVFPIRVYIEDTDAAGIVYYANYLKFVERARTELLRAMGHEHNALMAGANGYAFAVRRCTADYLKPAKLDDLLDIHTRVVAVGGASLDLEQIVRRRGLDLARVDIRLACMELGGKPIRIPKPLREAFAAFAAGHSDSRS